MGMILHSMEDRDPEEDVKALMAQKDLIEAELNTQFAILAANSATMQTRLVDAEGFPRADLDIYAIRHARVRIIELNNDLKAVMDDIATVMPAVFRARVAANAANETAPSSSPLPISTPTTSEKHSAVTSTQGELKPFAKVNGVAPNSPAASAGLMREDLILEFGHLTYSSFTASSLQPLSQLVAAHENRPLHVKVRRQEQETLVLQFTPRSGWGGRGMLGCHIIPI